ncbi:MAG: signal transduction histidine kinase [Cocleimonas sp.]|jgi:signal transduction histidine kinase
MGNLFWKIFLWFWLTLILITATVSWGTAIYLQNSDAYQQRDLRSRYINNRIELLRQVIYYGGEEAATDVLENKRLSSSRTTVYVVDDNNKDILGRSVDMNNSTIKKHESVESTDGETYQIYSTLRPRTRNTLTRMMRPFQRSPGIYLLWLGIAVLLSGLVCFGLARYLSQPIRKLQLAARKLSQGALDTRVSDSIGNRRDEIADLGHDFDQMAARLQSLINNQKQLLSDISHELRSPLARMQLAVGLARKKLGPDVPTEIDRIEQETERLDELVGQSLTLSRLDAGAAYAKDDFIDIGKLLENIISHCNFEATEQNKKVVFNLEQSWTIPANSELLHRALENIIRNAIRYTEVDTFVEVDLSQLDKQQFKISIGDQGPGVPENKISSLFEPFVRLSEARDRDSGGYGLGLAIAKRAIEFHQGHISAKNKPSGGLLIEVVLPLDNIKNN